jgi:hypothetical protein
VTDDGTFASRIVELSLTSGSEHKNLRMYGLNICAATDLRDAGIIRGETVAFAVVNTMTGGAKAYTVSIAETPQLEPGQQAPNDVVFSETQAAIQLGDGRQAVVTMLVDDPLKEMSRELFAAGQGIESNGLPTHPPAPGGPSGVVRISR